MVLARAAFLIGILAGGWGWAWVFFLAIPISAITAYCVGGRSGG